MGLDGRSVYEGGRDESLRIVCMWWVFFSYGWWFFCVFRMSWGVLYRVKVGRCRVVII